MPLVPRRESFYPRMRLTIETRNRYGKTVRFLDPPDELTLDAVVAFQFADTCHFGILLLVYEYADAHEAVQEALIGIHGPDQDTTSFYRMRPSEIHPCHGGQRHGPSA